MSGLLDSLFSDLYVFTIGRGRCLGSVKGFFRKRNLVCVVGNVGRSINGGTGYSDVVVELRAVSGCVNGCAGDADLVFVDRRLDTRAVLAFNAVNGRVVRFVVMVNLNGRLRVGG